MLERVTNNIWSCGPGVYCITTNGNVKKDGTAVMGKGIALDAKSRLPGIEVLLGEFLRLKGNKLCVFNGVWKSENGQPCRIITFPTKHNWWERSDIKLIEQSAHALAHYCQNNPNDTIYLPRPGCGGGGLSWEKEVKPILEKILPDNVIIISKE